MPLVDSTAGVRYIKVAKIDKDGNDNTNTLQSLTQIIIPYSTGNVTYKILDISEKPTFFQYAVSNPNIEWVDRAEIEYDFTGSLLSNPSLPSTRIVSMSVETDNLSFYKEYTPSRNGLDHINGSQYYFSTYPQKIVNIRVTGSIHSVSPSANISLRKNFENLGSQNISTGITSSFEFIYTGSILPGDAFFVYIVDQGDPNKAPVYSFTPDTKFYVTSSLETGPEIETIPEPYFSDNFARDLDCHPTLNNAIEARINTFYQDVDYNTGILNPTNFTLLINNTALRADVQDSNYSSLRHITPRYLGSKNQSSKINEWENSDLNIGNYGKTPSVESLKTYVAYCDFIGGWPPERMNSSGFKIRYLIGEDGDLVQPNTTPNSLENNQGTFESGERVLISTPDPGSGEEKAYRTVIRGGTRIEPILYTQLGHSPASWTGSINMVSIDFVSDALNIGDYQANVTPSSDSTLSSTPTPIPYNNIISQGSESSWESGSPYGFIVTAGQINEGIDINLNITNGYLVSVPFNTPNNYEIVTKIYIKRGSNDILITQSYLNGSLSGINYNNLNITLPISTLQVNDIIYVNHSYTNSGPENILVIHRKTLSSYIISQTPSPTNLSVTSTGTNTIWGYPTGSNLNVITCSNSTLNVLYNNPYIKQESIVGSGFNEISLPWSLKVGDEFRFEGREDRTYMVTYIIPPGSQDEERVGNNSGSLEIHFNSNLPSQSINLDHFAVRRYINDASYGLIQGFRPTGTNGPYIIRPEFISKKLDENIGNYIKDLTEKGLL